MRLAPLFVLAPLSLLAGCAMSTNTPQANFAADSSMITGRVFGGQQPVSGAVVTVYEVGNTGYGTGAVAHTPTTTTAADGSFSFSPTAYTCTSANAPTYIVAEGGDAGAGTNPNISLMAGLGPCSAAHTAVVNINEVTTAATVFSLAQFFSTSLGAGVPPTIGGPSSPSIGYSAGLTAAMNNTLPQLVNTATGDAVPSSATGNLTITRESAKLYTIANALAACVNSSGETSSSETATPCGQLFAATTPPGGSTRPYTTAQAALMMALYPWLNVGTIFDLSGRNAPFVGLTSAPNDWTLAVAYANPTVGVNINASPLTSMTIDIDGSGRIWFPSSQPGAVGVSFFDPASTSFNGPYNNGLSLPQYVAIDTAGIAWASDLASNKLLGVNTTSPGSLTTLTVDSATALGPVLVDTSNNLLTTFPGASGLGLAFFPPSRTTPTLLNNITPLYTNTGLADLQSGYYAGAFATGRACALYDNTGGQGGPWAQTAATPFPNCSSGGITPNSVSFGAAGTLLYAVMSATSTNQVCDDFTPTCTAPAVGLFGPEGITTDGNDDLWVANSSNSSVSTFHGLTASGANYATTSPVPYIHDSTHGGTLTNPFAIRVDFSGNVWTMSPGCVGGPGAVCAGGGMVLTQIVGAAGPTITPLAAAEAAGIGTRPQY